MLESRDECAAGRKAVAGKTQLMKCPRAELYSFLRDFNNLSETVRGIELVKAADDVSVWRITASSGKTLTFETEVVEERENELLSWKSTADSEVCISGHVSFRDASPGPGTWIETVVEYSPAAGGFGELIEELFRKVPQDVGALEQPYN